MTESSENLVEYRRILMSIDSDEPIEERVSNFFHRTQSCTDKVIQRAAVAIIDETLYKRGKMKLIINQPLHPVERKPLSHRPQPPAFHGNVPRPAPMPAPKATIQRPTPITQPRPATNGIAGPRPVPSPFFQATVGSSKQPVVGPPRPRPSVPGSTSNAATAGPSRRPPSPVQVGEPPKKKLKAAPAAGVCSVCGTSPLHVLQQCPAILEGPKR